MWSNVVSVKNMCSVVFCQCWPFALCIARKTVTGLHRCHSCHRVCRLLSADIQVSLCLPHFSLPAICPCSLPSILFLYVFPVICALPPHFSQSLLSPSFTPFPLLTSPIGPCSFCSCFLHLITSRVVPRYASLASVPFTHREYEWYTERSRTHTCIYTPLENVWFIHFHHESSADRTHEAMKF